MSIFFSRFGVLLSKALGAVVAISFGRFLGSEGIAHISTGRNLVLFAMLILGWIFLFRHLYMYGRKNKMARFLLKVMYVAILLAISVFLYSIRSNILSYFSLFLSGILCPYIHTKKCVRWRNHSLCWC